MKPHQERVVQEFDELNDKHSKLVIFQQTELYKSLDRVDQNLLQEQKMAMRDYLDILILRINRFNL